MSLVRFACFRRARRGVMGAVSTATPSPIECTTARLADLAGVTVRSAQMWCEEFLSQGREIPAPAGYHRVTCERRGRREFRVFLWPSCGAHLVDEVARG